MMTIAQLKNQIRTHEEAEIERAARWATVDDAAGMMNADVAVMDQAIID